MKHAFYVPNFGACGDVALLADLAAESEASGWDGFFIWDHLQFPGMEPAVDPWVALTAIALATHRVRIGPMVTPLPRCDVVELARASVSLDRLSNGRLILGVGLGYQVLPEWSAFGHETDAATRGAMLDEGLEVLDALWRGEALAHRGKYYHCVCDGFSKPVQRPRIPVWVAGQWPGRKPFRRAARWDGVIPMAKTAMDGGSLDAGDVASLRQFIAAQEPVPASFDLATFGVTAGADDTARVAKLGAAGLNWWIEVGQTFDQSLEQVRARIRSGPVKV